MRIDSYLRAPHHAERHSIAIGAPPECVYPLARHLDFNDSRVTRWLFRLRGMPADDLRIDAMLSPAGTAGFTILEERPPEEFVIGVMARGTRAEAIPDGEAFRRFRPASGLRIAWNFAIAPAPGGCKVTTITRVECFGAAVRTLFALYWLVIRPFSGWIRREMLRLLKQQAESSAPT